MVISKIDDDLEKQLEKYNENLRVDQYVSQTREELIADKRSQHQMIKETSYAKYLSDPEEYERSCTNQNHLNWIKNEFPKILEMSDDELYQEAIKYYSEEEIGPNGEIYSTYNPDSKWDWYEIGGRFAGALPVKEGITPITPNFSWGWDEDEIEETLNANCTDIALVGTIDFSKIHRTSEKYKDAIKFWEVIVEGRAPKNKEEKEMVKFSFYKPDFYINRYRTKEKYAECVSSFYTWAVVKDGVWHEQGEMGMFAMSNETDDEAVDWQLNFYDRFIKDLPEDYLITIVDCHI
jgi:hypothetical protein